VVENKKKRKKYPKNITNASKYAVRRRFNVHNSSLNILRPSDKRTSKMVASDNKTHTGTNIKIIGTFC